LEAARVFDVFDLANQGGVVLARRLVSALVMALALCLLAAGACAAMLLAIGREDKQYRFFVNNAETRVESFTSLAEAIKNETQPAVFKVALEDGVILESVQAGVGDLAEAEREDYKKYDYSDGCRRLRMYAEPDMIDLIARQIWVERTVFHEFVTDAVMFDISHMRISAKPVFFR
jgi:hypothetical protein